MDGDNNYESDVSETWSVIDDNVTEEPVIAFEAYSSENPEESPPSDILNGKLSNNFKVNDSLQGSEENSDICQNGSDSDEWKNDSCDGDSIEILDLDLNYRDSDIDKFDVLTINDTDIHTINQSYDKESFNENIYNLPITKKRKRKQCRLSKNSCNDVNSSIFSVDKKHENIHPIDAKKSDVLALQVCKSNQVGVYKHHRNNFTNTALSLSLGVIFAGVACIAIGHFLGVQDAEKTSDDLMASLKKLQMENVVLQSRLVNLKSHMDRAILIRDTNSKFEKKITSESQDGCQEKKAGPDLFPKEDLKIYEKSRSESCTGDYLSNKWLSKLQNLMRSKKFLGKEGILELGKIVAYINGQLSCLGAADEENIKIKYIEESNAKITKILNRIQAKLSLSQDNLKNIHKNLLELQNKLNKYFNVIFSEGKHGNTEKKFEKDPSVVDQQERLPFQWNRHPTEFLKENPLPAKKPIVLYKFPQTEEYYINEENKAIENETNFGNAPIHNIDIAEEEVSVSPKEHTEESNGDVKTIGVKENEKPKSSASKHSNKQKSRKINRMKFHTEKQKRNLKLKKNVKKKKQGQCKMNVDMNKSYESQGRGKDIETRRKNKRNTLKKSNEKLKENMKKKKYSSETRTIVKDQNRKHKGMKMKGKCKYSKHFQKIWLKENDKMKRFPILNGLDDGNYLQNHLNGTGDWVFKWANGRQEFRRHQTQSDWQFERAKGREEKRDGHSSLNWQFERALARENERNQIYWDDENYKDYNGRYFHDEFSWILG